MLTLTCCVCSPQEAWQAFEAARIDRAQFQEAGAALVASPELVCRLDGLLVPWQQAAPALLGALAFGGQWDHLLPEGAGVQAAPPERPSLDTKKACPPLLPVPLLCTL